MQQGMRRNKSNYLARGTQIETVVSLKDLLTVAWKLSNIFKSVSASKEIRNFWLSSADLVFQAGASSLEPKS